MENFESTGNGPKSTSETEDAASSDATSKKTLSDIEDEQRNSGSGADDDSAVPSPDGQPRERMKDEGGRMKESDIP